MAFFRAIQSFCRHSERRPRNQCYRFRNSKQSNESDARQSSWTMQTSSANAGLRRDGQSQERMATPAFGRLATFGTTGGVLAYNGAKPNVHVLFLHAFAPILTFLLLVTLQSSFATHAGYSTVATCMYSPTVTTAPGWPSPVPRD